MAKRWVMARMGEYGEPGELVPKIDFYTDSYRIWSKAGLAWCMGQVATANVAAMQADPDIMVLPDTGLDTAWLSIPSATRTNIRDWLLAQGFSKDGLTSTSSIRDVLHSIVHQIQEGIDIEQGDVQDIES